MTLLIHVHSGWYNHPGILALMADGHGVRDMALRNSDAADLIIHPAAGWTEDMLAPDTRKNGDVYYPYLLAAVQGTKDRQKGPK